MKINYGIIAYSLTGCQNETLNVLHFCGYEHPITNFDLKDLENELNTDEEFGLVGRINKDVFLMEAPAEIVEEMRGKTQTEIKVADDEKFLTQIDEVQTALKKVLGVPKDHTGLLI